MVRFSSRWLVAPAAAVGVIAILFAEPSDGRRTESGIEAVAASTDPTEMARGRESARIIEIFAVRITYKESLVKQLVDGKTTLCAAAEEFLRLNREVPSTLNMIRLQYSNVTEEEAVTLNVLDFVLQRLEPGAVQNAVLARLGAEFRKQYGHAAQNLP